MFETHTKGLICTALTVAIAGSLALDADAQRRGRRAPPPPPEAPTQDSMYVGSATWAKLPGDRKFGANSAVYPDPDGVNIWVAERCGANMGACDRFADVDPVLLFDPAGNLLKSFGAGMISWPHGIHVDAEGNVWIADAAGSDGKGHQVIKFSSDGEVLMRLGEAGVPGNDQSHFNQPSDVLVAPDGSIFVVDGHGAGNNNRVVKFSSDGTFIKEWGGTGYGPGEFRDPHALAMDSQGRLFVGDRANSRIQLFTQDGDHIATWTQFGRPSGVYIDKNDIMYVADSESRPGNNPGYKRGIRIGSATDGFVTHLIEDPQPYPYRGATSAGEGVAADAAGNIYSAEVGPQRLIRYAPRDMR